MMRHSSSTLALHDTLLGIMYRNEKGTQRMFLR